MVTQSQIARLDSQIERLTQSLGLNRKVRVTVWGGDTRQAALARHLEAHPGDAHVDIRYETMAWMPLEAAMARGWA